tara:strand:+ start:162 stop:428 length:267 start_codon:yes stop_codon:yes gene_type:complete
MSLNHYIILKDGVHLAKLTMLEKRACTITLDIWGIDTPIKERSDTMQKAWCKVLTNLPNDAIARCFITIPPYLPPLTGLKGKFQVLKF